MGMWNLEHKGKKTKEKTGIRSKILRFSLQQQNQKIKSFKCYLEKNKKMGRTVIVRTGTYL